VTTVLIAGGGSGGHLMPALAVATALRERHPDWRLLLVGAERGVEAQLLPARDFPYLLLPFEPIYRRQWWKNVRWPVLAFRLIRRVTALLTRERPALVVGTGGYVAGPVVWLAARRGVPTAIMEQDAYPGLVTRWLAGRVDEVFLGAPEAETHLAAGPRTEVRFTGSPIVPPTPTRREAARARFGLTDERPVVLVTGGSQGSLAINRLVAGWLDGGGGRGVMVLWAAGRVTADQFLGYHRPPAVQVFPFLDPIADAYAVADLVVARAGMTTIAELCAWGLPSLLIPLPTAAADHQRKNAEAMVAAGAARSAEQGSLTPDALGRLIDELIQNPDTRRALAARARERGRPGAVAEIATRLEALVRA